MNLARHSRNRILNIEGSVGSSGPINPSAGLVSEREIAYMGAGCHGCPGILSRDNSKIVTCAFAWFVAHSADVVFSCSR